MRKATISGGRNRPSRAAQARIVRKTAKGKFWEIDSDGETKSAFTSASTSRALSGITERYRKELKRLADR